MKLFIFIALALFVGCANPRKTATPPKASVTTPTGTVVTQQGDTPAPAKVETKATVTTVALPLGTNLVFDQNAGTVEVRLAQPSTLRQTTNAERVEMPKSFTPPAPPTELEIAKGESHKMFWIGLVIGVAAAVFGLVRAWNLVMYGGIAVAAACGFALFVQEHPLVFWLIGFGVFLKVLGPTLWHTILKHKQPAEPTS